LSYTPIYGAIFSACSDNSKKHPASDQYFHIIAGELREAQIFKGVETVSLTQHICDA
jgi:hypothetical protein